MELSKTVLNSLVFVTAPFLVPDLSYFWLLALLPIFRIGEAHLDTPIRKSYLLLLLISSCTGVILGSPNLEQATLPCIVLTLITILNYSVTVHLHDNFLKLELMKERFYLNSRMTTASSVASGLAHEINNPINLKNGSSVSIQNI